jgi:peptidoglycan/LPS O-acetylase OafA/YrhL
MEQPMTSDQETGMRGRIPSLDGLRAVAILLVLAAHGFQTHGAPAFPAVRALAKQGAIGVEIFFVISGFLITTLIVREHAREGSISLKNFYWRRALRILPAYICYLAAVSLMSWSGTLALRKTDWIAAITYTVNFVRHPSWEIGHIWSLSIEEHFYLFWPMILFIWGPQRARGIAIGCIVIAFVLRWYILLVMPAWSQMAELWTFTRVDSIAFGCLLALQMRENRWRVTMDRLSRNNRLIIGALTVLALSVVYLSRSGKYTVGVGYSLNAFLISFLLWAGIRRDKGPVGRILNSRAITTIGVGSYSLYLWQQIFLDPTMNLWINRFPQNLLFATAAAALSYALIERPFLKLKDSGALRLRLNIGTTVNEMAGLGPRGVIENA